MKGCQLNLWFQKYPYPPHGVIVLDILRGGVSQRPKRLKGSIKLN